MDKVFYIAYSHLAKGRVAVLGFGYYQRFMRILILLVSPCIN